MFRKKSKVFDPLPNLKSDPNFKSRQEAFRKAAINAKANPDPKTLKPKPEMTQTQKDNLVKALRRSADARRPRPAPPNIANRIAKFMGKPPALAALSIFLGSTPVSKESELTYKTSVNKKYRYSNKTLSD